MKIRHYGLLGNRNKKTKLAICKKLTNTANNHYQELSTLEILKKTLGVDFNLCPVCHNGTIIYARLEYEIEVGQNHQLAISDSMPEIIAQDINTSNLVRKTDKAIAELFEITWGSDGTGTIKYDVTGSLTFKSKDFSSGEIANLSELELGTYTIKCTVSSKTNGGWIPIGYWDEEDYFTGKYFAGIFEGNNHTITLSSMTTDTKYRSTGIFGMVIGGEIYNLTSKGTNASEVMTGGIAGAIKDGKIENCQNYCTITAEIGIVKAGISGVTDNSQLNKCKNFANISGYSQIGGICGTAGDNSKINDCVNSGTISYYLTSGVSTAGGGLGGNSGFIYNASVEQCYNNGLVRSVYINGNQSMNNIGEIVGFGCTATIKNCYNLENIYGHDYVGGIIGFAYNNSIINNCYTSGENINGNSNVGEFAGYTNSVTGTNNSSFGSTTVVGSESGCSWSNYEAYTLTQMKTLNSGLLTLLNSGDGADLWTQATDVNDGLPYLKNVAP